jgi:hypothetical protein
LALALAALAPGGCRGCDEATPASNGAPGAPAPVPEPSGLLAEFVVPKPAGTWQKVRTLAGGSAQLLPAGFPLLVAALLGLPLKAAELIDNDVPLVAALSADLGEAVGFVGSVAPAGGAAGPVPAERFVAGVHVRDGARFVAALTEGAEARHVARVDATPMLTLLEPKPGAATGPSLGVLGNYALVARDVESLRRLGPYVARTLPARPAGGEDVAVVAKRQGLAGPLRERLRGWWAVSKGLLEASERRERERHGGAEPTFANPAAALAKADASVAEIVELLGDLGDVRATLTLDELGLHARAALVPAGVGGPAERAFNAWAVGPAAPLLALPDGVALALLLRGSAEERKRGAGEQTKALGELFGGRLPEGDLKRVDEALALWAEGRGDWLVAGIDPAEGRRAIYAMSGVADAKALDRGIRRLLELPSLPAFAAPLARWAGPLRVGEVAPIEGSSGSLVRFERRAPAPESATGGKPGTSVEANAGGKPGTSVEANAGGKPGTSVEPDAPPAPERFELAWSVSPERASFAAATDGRAALRALDAAPPTSRLSNDSDVRRAIEAVGSDVSFALLALPLRARRGAEAPSAPLLLAAGRSGSGAWVRGEAAPLAARELGALLSERIP